MAPISPQRQAYRDKFRSLHRKEFQAWFEDLARALYPPGDFQVIRETSGDGGLDGFVISRQLVYQIYAPPRIAELRDGEVAEKIRASFARALSTLGGQLKAWHFVHNHPEAAIGQITAATINDLAAVNPGIEIKALDIDSLWDLLASRLSTRALRRLFPSEPVEQLSHLFAVPQRQSRHLVPRDQLLGTIRRQLESGESPVVLYGLGGIGKTQLALEYAYRFRKEYRIVQWVRAERAASSQLGDYVALSVPLGLSKPDTDNPWGPVDTVRSWLEEHDGWLLVFDNAESPLYLSNYLPSFGHGHVLVTSRNPSWKESGGKPLEIDVFSTAEAVQFLLARTGETDQSAAGTLAELLDNLPLALDQAASYMDEAGLSLQGYVSLYLAHPSDLLRRGTPSQGHRETVATTFAITLARIKGAGGAADLLNLLSFLPPDQASLLPFRQRTDRLPSLLGNAIKLIDAVAVLRRYSLIRVDHDKVSIHRLVREIARDRLSEEEVKRYRAVLVDLGLVARYPAGTICLSVKELKSRYGRSGPWVLRGMNLAIFADCVTAIIGPSGSGRSTLLRCLDPAAARDADLYVEGDVELYGRSLYSTSRGISRGWPQIASVIQPIRTMPLSIQDNVAYELRYLRRLMQLDPEALAARVEWALRLTGLWSEVAHHLHEDARLLSIGQQQRLMVARALALRPEVLLLDYLALEPMAQALLEEAIHQLKGQMTIVLSANDLQMVARVADFTALIYLGEIVEFSDTYTIFTNPAKKQTEDFITGRFF